MNGHDDTRLAELLSDAVSDVEPRSALEDIRDRTRVTSITSRRPWLLATGGTVIATAAVITAIAFAGGGLTGTTTDPGPALPGESETAEPNPPNPTEVEDNPPTSEPELPGRATVPVYYVGDTPAGPRLYREFRQTETSDELTTALELALSGLSEDPDYRSVWPQGTRIDGASYDGDVITVDLGTDGDLRSRGGMAEDEAAMAIEQLIYTAQAVLQKGRPGVQFLVNANRADQILGVPTAEPLANGPILETLALVSLTTPGEGAATGGTLEVTGVANSFEANVVVRVEEYETQVVLVEQPFTATGYGPGKLFPFTGSLDLSDVPPGTYLLSASTSDPSGGAEGNGPHVDTRTIIVE